MTVSPTDTELDRAAHALRTRLERVLEYHIPSENPDRMEVSKAQAWREREWARRQAGKSVTVPTSPRRNWLDQPSGCCDGCGGNLTYEIHPRWVFSYKADRTVDVPVIKGKETLIRCDRCHLIGVPHGSPSERIEA